jgi:hypothetical protein
VAHVTLKFIALRLITLAHVLLICILPPAPNPQLSVWCKSYLTLWNHSEIIKLWDLLRTEKEQPVLFFNDTEFCQPNQHARISIQLSSFLTVRHKDLQKENECAYWQLFWDSWLYFVLYAGGLTSKFPPSGQNTYWLCIC